jgi:hypothetical protein
MWNVLHQLGERVLMCDTDSVKYYSTCVPGEFQIKHDNTLGQWEDEGELSQFVSIGLKSYCTRYGDGSGETLKLKGCSLKRAHRNLMNFDVMKSILMDGENAKIPQLSFDYKFGQGITTREFLKTVPFDSSILKGDYDPTNYRVYPFGYDRKLYRI